MEPARELPRLTGLGGGPPFAFQYTSTLEAKADPIPSMDNSGHAVSQFMCLHKVVEVSAEGKALCAVQFILPFSENQFSAVGTSPPHWGGNCKETLAFFSSSPLYVRVP